MDVFFFETFEEEEKIFRKNIPGGISAGYSWETIQEYENREPPASFISIRTQSVFPVIWEDKVSGILTRSTGYDHIHRFWNNCKTHIPSGYLPRYCSRAVAEHAMLLWMSVLRKLSAQIAGFAQFNRNGLTGSECESKVLLVVGVGNIGYEIVKIGNGLGMEVLGTDIVKRYPSVQYVEIDEGLERADIIVCAMNLTSDNRGYFDYGRLKKAKDSVIFINIARGELVPSTVLLRLVEEKRLGGVGLDVFSNECELGITLRRGRLCGDPEVAAILKLSHYPGVVLTPHNAFNTRESIRRKTEQSIQQVVHFLNKGCFLWPVPAQ